MKIKYLLFSMALLFSASTPINSDVLLVPLDSDGDSYPDEQDNCTFVANQSQQDEDNDGFGNRCDADFNNDGIVDHLDQEYFQFVLGQPSDYVIYYSDADFNSDNFIDVDDELIFSELFGHPPGPSEIGDLDHDGVFDSIDNCPLRENRGQEDFDGNAVGDACDDRDGDNIFDLTDNCILIINTVQNDADNDGYGNICDGDLNNDGITDALDEDILMSLIGTSNSNADINGDGTVDAADQDLFLDMFGFLPGPSLIGDIDYDGVFDALDNCPAVSNGNQMDLDDDGIGAVCDPDEGFITIGVENRVNDYTQRNQDDPAIAMDHLNNYVVVWYGRGENSLYDDIYARRFNSLDEPLGDSFKVNTSDDGYQSEPAIDMNDDGTFVIVWRDSSSSVYAQRYDAKGERIGTEIQITETLTRSKFGPAVALDVTGGFIVAWDSSEYGEWEIYARNFDSNGAPVASEYKVNTTIKGHSRSYWTHQQAPAISYSPLSGYVIVWGGKDGLYLQKYNQDGTAIDDEFMVAYSGNLTAGYPDITHDKDGGFVVVWKGASSEDSNDIFARAFDTNGIPKANEFKVNSYTLERQSQPAISMNEEGDFIIIWHSWAQNDAYDIFAQRYNSSAQKDGGEFQVNSYTERWQDRPDAILSDDGNLLIAWRSSGQDGSSTGIYTQRFAIHTDTDNDGLVDDSDNCPLISNPDQTDFDGDTFGDVCDFDADGDNIENTTDQCPVTPVGESTNPDGCSIAQLCSCNDTEGSILEWKNHGQYQSCIAHETKSFVKLGLMSNKERTVIVTSAANNQCGHSQ